MGLLPCFPHSNSQSCIAGQRVSLTTYCPWATGSSSSSSSCLLSEHDKPYLTVTRTILAKKIFRLSILVYLLTNEMNIILFQINIYFVLLLLDLMTACIHQGSNSQSFWKYSGVIALQTSFEIRNLLFFLL